MKRTGSILQAAVATAALILRYRPGGWEMRLRHMTLSNALVVSLRMGMAVALFLPSSGTTAGLDVNGDGTVDLEELAHLAAMVRDVSRAPDANGDGVQSLDDLFALVESTDWPAGGSGASPPETDPGGNVGIEFSAVPLEMDAVSGEAVELTLSVDGMSSVSQFEIVLEVTPGVFDLAAADLIPRIVFGGFLVFPAQVESATTVRLGMTLLADEGVSGDGNMAIRLPVLDDLTGGTAGQVTVKAVSLGPNASHRVALSEEVLGLSSLVRVSAPAPATLDYDEDGVVGAGDFQIWADRFGSVVGEASYDLVFDVDGDDRVGYGDFFILGDNFGRASADAEIRTPARSQGARLAGDNAGATFSLTSAATVSGVGTGQAVTINVAGTGFVGVKNMDVYVRFTDAAAFDLSQVAITTSGGMAGWIGLAGLLEAGTTDLVRIGAATFGAGFTGNAGFAITAVTSASFTSETQATMEIERISIGPSSSVRDVFVDPGLRVDINGGATTAPRFSFSGPGELNGVGPGEVISTDLLVSQPIPVTAFELVVELLPRGAFDLSSLTFSTATHVLLDSPTQALAARISLTSLGVVGNLGTLQVTTAPGFTPVTGATIRVTELEVLDIGTGLHTVYAPNDLDALLVGLRGLAALPAGAQTISTVAGTGTSGFSGDGGSATSAELSGPSKLYVDSAGNVYFSDANSQRVRKIDTGGIIATVAGNGTSGAAGDGGSATAASVHYPRGVYVDGAGNLYIGQEGIGGGGEGHRARKVAAGTITTIAGAGPGGYSGDGGPATSANLNEVQGVYVDLAGNVYLADRQNHRVRKVDTSGTITTFAGNGTAGSSGDGGAATAAQLNLPVGVTGDAAGNIYIADGGNHRIRKVTSGTITTYAGIGTAGFSGDGGQATSARLNSPADVDEWSGSLYIADQLNHRIRKVDSSGVITTVAGNGTAAYGGDGGAATDASLRHPSGVAVDAAGNLHIADSANNRIRKVIVNRTGVGVALTAVGPNADCGATPPLDCVTLTAGFAEGATDGLDLGLDETELPPVPPTTEIFDARFLIPGNQGLLLDLRDPDGENPEWQIAVQAGFGGYPVSFSWDPATMPEGSWRMRSLDGGQAIDVDMNNTSSAQITDPMVTRLGITFSTSTPVSLTYGQRWNMVSLPVIPADNTFNVLFPDAISAFAFSGGYQQITQLEPCTGYWLNLTDGGTYQLTGGAVSQCVRTLPEHWSIQGVPLRGTRVDDVVQNPPDNLLSVFAFEGAYVQKTGQSLLAEGRGFWLDLATAGQVILNSDPGGATRVVPVASSDVVPPVLWARSGEWRQEIQLGVAPEAVIELPPAPPAGVLDARAMVGDGDGSWQVPLSAGPAEYALVVQGPQVELGWAVPAAQGDLWELVLGDVSVPLTGMGTIDLGTQETPGQLTLRQVNGLPSAFSLTQNYPNPFNPATTIRYDLKATGPVSLAVYDITGQLVRQLVAGEQAAGRYTVTWDGANVAATPVASGVYLYELRAGSFRSVHKMLLMK